jgi:hypothetical protein
MTEHDEALDRFLDSLMQGLNPDESDLDPGSADAARRLMRAGSGPRPGPAFVNQLESLLVEQSKPGAASGAQSRNAGIGIALRASEPRWRPHPVLATAAILTLVFVSLLSVVRFGDSTNGGNATIAGVFQAASASAHSELAGSPVANAIPSTDECLLLEGDTLATAIAERAANFPPLLYSQIPGSYRPAIAPPHSIVTIFSQSDLPVGVEPSSEARIAIERSLRREVACRNAGEAGWPEALQGFGVESSPEAGAQPTIIPAAVPEIISMTELPDGRVGVLLGSDLYGAGFESYLLFAPFQGAWIFDAYGLVAPDDWLMQSYTGQLSDSIEIDLYDVYFFPYEAEIPLNKPVTVTVTNHGDKPHTFTIERLNISLTLQPGQSETLNLNADAGSYPFLTDLPNNGDWSVAGIIWAIDRSDSATPAS